MLLIVGLNNFTSLVKYDLIIGIEIDKFLDVIVNLPLQSFSLILLTTIVLYHGISS